MFIELTDHLRCPADHPESFLVLVPDVMDGRRVLQGTLGCPICHAEYRITDGIADLGVAAQPPAPPAAESTVDAAAILAFLGLEGPGGYLGLVGDASRLAPGLQTLLPGVHLVAVNPPAGTLPTSELSLIWAPRMPLKARTLRGVVVGRPFASDAGWGADAVRSVLPGLRAAGQGPVPDVVGFELLGSAEGWWVGRVA